MRPLLSLVFLFSALMGTAQNFSNKGKEFWVGYGHNGLFFATTDPNSQNFVLYLSADEPARVKVSVANSGWEKIYNIPANTVITSDFLPKAGIDDCRILAEGVSEKAIHIESDVPIVAYSHVYGVKTSGATMLAPVDTYGYTYYSLNTEQVYGYECHGWFYVIAAADDTRVRITPSRPSFGGKAEGIPFTVNLKKGQIYNLLGGVSPGGYFGFDLSGSKIESIEGADGICHPITVFSGSSRTYICIPSTVVGGGDFIMQQILPSSAWGVRYLTAPASSSLGVSSLNINKYRVYVRFAGTAVYRNGIPLTTLINNFYYEFTSSTADFITADNPIMVAQLMFSGGACGSIGEGDPEMISLSPIEQSIKKITFYSTDKEKIYRNYLTIIIPSPGLGTLLIDGENSYDSTYAHPNLPGYHVVLKDLPVAASQHTVQSEFAFTAVTYGLGLLESYGYNAGTYINNLTAVSHIKNKYNLSATGVTCPKSPFSVILKTIYPLTGITWHFDKVANFAPTQQVVIPSPVFVRKEILNNRTYYVYESPVECRFLKEGNYKIPVSIRSPQIDNCSKTDLFDAIVEVTAPVTVDFRAQPVCAKDFMNFQNLSAFTHIGVNWDFGDGTSDSISVTRKVYPNGGTYNVRLQLIRESDGCVGDTTKPVIVYHKPVSDFEIPEAVCMPGGLAVFKNRSTTTNSSSANLSTMWNFGDGTSAVTFDGSHRYSSTGAYDVILVTTSPEGCKDTITKPLKKFTSISARLKVSKDSACSDHTITLTDESILPVNSSSPVRVWNFDDGSSGTGVSVDKKFSKPGIHNIYLTVTTVEGCADTTKRMIFVLTSPIVDAGPDLKTEPGKPVLLKGSVGDPTASLLWQPATYLSATNNLSPMCTPLQQQQYFLTAKSLNGCTATDSIQVVIYAGLKIPNAFTPNNDGRNDRWLIPGLSENRTGSVRIYNRWGQLVYRGTATTQPWDGTLRGQALPSGAYQYVVDLRSENKGLYTGSVVIIR